LQQREKWKKTRRRRRRKRKEGKKPSNEKTLENTLKRREKHPTRQRD
jgi:hypothetical protein